jgi:hypothetical protein
VAGGPDHKKEERKVFAVSFNSSGDVGLVSKMLRAPERLLLLGLLLLQSYGVTTAATFQWTSPTTGNFSGNNWNAGACHFSSYASYSIMALVQPI